MLRDRMAKVEARTEVRKVLVLEFELPGWEPSWGASKNNSEYQLEKRGSERWSIKVDQDSALATAEVLVAVAQAITKAMKSE